VKSKKRVDLEEIKRHVDKEGARAELTRGEATLFLAGAIVRKYGCSVRVARNRMGMFIDREKLSKTEGGKYTLDVIAYSLRRSKYCDLFMDLPFHGRGKVVMPSLTGRGIAGWPSPPNTVLACHAYIARLQKQFSQCEKEKTELARKLQHVSRLKRVK